MPQNLTSQEDPDLQERSLDLYLRGTARLDMTEEQDQWYREHCKRVARHAERSNEGDN